MIERCGLEHFRAFVSPVEIDLRPITLFFGYNNSGKSAILRGIVALLESLRGDLGYPWTTNPLLTRGAVFSDFTSTPLTGRPPFLKCSLRFKEGDDHVSSDWTIRSNGKDVFISDFHFESEKQGKLTGRAVAESNPNIGIGWLFEITDGEIQTKATITFEGLCPIFSDSSSASLELETRIFRFGKMLPNLQFALQWLGPSRQPPPRSYRASGTWAKPLAPDGKGVLDFLISESEGDSPRLGKVGLSVSSWFEKHFQRRLALQANADRFDLAFVPLTELPAASSLASIPLVDSGEGVSQVLPVLVALRRAAQGGDYNPYLLCIEEPESHLHPKYHGALAEAFIEAAKDAKRIAIIAETHSENLLLRLQLAIARKEIPSNSVLVYWIRQSETGESRAKKVTFDDRGNPQGEWPPTVFGEDIRLATELLHAQRADVVATKSHEGNRS
jgi:hypothetical protein